MDGPHVDRTAVVRDLFDRIPFNRAHDLTIESVTETEAVASVPFAPDVVGNPERDAIHGGVISALVDVTGAALFCGYAEDYTPTIDLRVDYLSHATGTIRCTANPKRVGGSVGVADMTVRDETDRVVAAGVGTYKLSERDD